MASVFQTAGKDQIIKLNDTRHTKEALKSFRGNSNSVTG
ncbi:hypothetical protein CCACVL1_12909 [Corchorus capsularis]|uniref:Uncharacterized protein n=1 Tax=Corchorus capsularis TaxID=210143 RepID=A0A1R3IDD9_COCAP|nr:hypothetical protein CCACVL1_12909 [Corchorus capsularis]